MLQQTKINHARPETWVGLPFAEQDALLREVEERFFVQGEYEKPSLEEFVGEAWAVVEPGEELQWGKHIEAICQHLEAVTDGKIKRLIINIQPKSMKSLLVSVFWPAWHWTRKPEDRFLCSSNDADLGMDLSIKCRDVIESDWYKSKWGDLFKLAGDQNVKSKFRNTRKGVRQAVPITGKVTGKGANIILIDDPHDVKDADSPVALEAAKRGFQALATRRNNPKNAVIVVIAQRVHEDDLCGELLAQGGWDHLCLPTEYEPTDRVTSIDWRDWRKEEGELLWPDRFDKEFLEQTKIDIGPYGYAAQYQQRPAPAGGGIFRSEWFKVIEPHETSTNLRKCRFWDFAATEEQAGKDPDYTVGFLMGQDPDGFYDVLDIIRVRKSPGEIEKLVKDTAESDGYDVVVAIEEEKGSQGKHTVDYYRRKVLPGYTVEAVPPWANKVARARPVSSKAQPMTGQKYGYIRVVRAHWNHDFFSEANSFPRSKHKDQVDGMSGSFFVLNKEAVWGNLLGNYAEAEIDYSPPTQ